MKIAPRHVHLQATTLHFELLHIVWKVNCEVSVLLS